jgi:malonate transporter
MVDDSVLSVLLITFPFFALVLCGYLAARRGVLPQPAIPGLNAFVLYFALPCMLYRFGASTPIAQLLDPAVAGVYLLCALVMVGAAVALTRNAAHRLERRRLWRPGGGLSQHRLHGRAAAGGAAGRAKRGPGHRHHRGGHGHHQLAVHCACRAWTARAPTAWAWRSSAFKGMATNPMPWSIALGALASALQFTLPGPVDKTVAMLADAASPVALFTIGAVLARSQMNQHEQVLVRDYVPIAWPNCWCTRCWCGRWVRRPSPWVCRSRPLR